MQIEQEDIDDVLSSFTELVHECEHCIGLIACGDGDIDELNSLFRAIHSIKGNAAMVEAKVLVDYTHSLEEVVDAIRGEQLQPSTMVCEAILLGIDRLRDLHERELQGQQFENLHERELEHVFSELAVSSGEATDELCQEVMLLLGAGFVLQQADSTSDAREPSEPKDAVACLTKPDGTSKLDFDLEFFRELALQVDRQSQFWTGRSDKLLGWALKMNECSDSPIDRNQLAVAVYMHDIGMTFISAQTLDKSAKLSESERNEIKQHPNWGYNYLIRVQGWDEAATIILEHHERVDGRGYPLGIKGDIIHPGAKMLAIIDAYFSITNGRADRANRRSIVRAISEINARKGTQFDEYWVHVFNDMIKNEIKTMEAAPAA